VAHERFDPRLNNLRCLVMKFGGDMLKNIGETIKNRHEPEEIRRFSDLYWYSLLISAFVVLILVFLYSTWALLRILNDLSSAPDTSGPPPPALNRAELNAVIQEFESRETEFENLKAARAPARTDPSR